MENNRGRTSLMLACIGGHLDTVQLILNIVQPKLELMQVDENGQNALMFACLNGHTDIVQHILQAYKRYSKLLLTYQDIGGWTALMCATQQGHLNVVRTILTLNSANVKPLLYAKSTHSDYQTPFTIAIENGYVEVVQYILKHHKKIARELVKIKNKYGLTPLMLACQSENVTMVEVLLNASKKMAISQLKMKGNGSTAMMRVCENGNLKLLTVILQSIDQATACMLVRMTNPSGQTPFALAAKNGHDQILRYFTHYFERSGKDFIVELLITDDLHGKTPITWAILKRQIDALEYLVSLPAAQKALMKYDNDGHAPLAHACKIGYLKAVECILETGKTSSIRLLEHGDRSGWTPLMWSCLFGHFEIVKYILVSHKEHAKFLLMMRDVEGWTPIMKCAGNGHLEVVQYICDTFEDFSADLISMSEFDGGTSLMFSAGNGKFEVTKYILEKFSRISTALLMKQDNDSWSPLSFAAYNGYWGIVDLILNSHESIARELLFTKENEGATPMHLAVMDGKFLVVHLILTKFPKMASELLQTVTYCNDNLLITCCGRGDLRLMSYFAASYPLITRKMLMQRNDEQQSALTISIAKEHLNIVKFLMQFFESENISQISYCERSIVSTWFLEDYFKDAYTSTPSPKLYYAYSGRFSQCNSFIQKLGIREKELYELLQQLDHRKHTLECLPHQWESKSVSRALENLSLAEQRFMIKVFLDPLFVQGFESERNKTLFALLRKLFFEKNMGIIFCNELFRLPAVQKSTGRLEQHGHFNSIPLLPPELLNHIIEFAYTPGTTVAYLLSH